MYWGYTVRVVPSFASILTDCPYEVRALGALMLVLCQ